MTEKETEEMFEVIDDMFDALVELLEEKGVITTEEWRNKIKKRIKLRD